MCLIFTDVSCFNSDPSKNTIQMTVCKDDQASAQQYFTHRLHKSNSKQLMPNSRFLS